MICVPVDCPELTCKDKECGDDGCGGVCGFCSSWDECSSHGICEYPCEGECDGRECGTDSCGRSCGSCPHAGYECTEDGQCVQLCEHECVSNTFGCEDGIGWVCGVGEDGCRDKEPAECLGPEDGAGNETDALPRRVEERSLGDEDEGRETREGGCSAGTGSADAGAILLLMIWLLSIILGRGRSASSRL